MEKDLFVVDSWRCSSQAFFLTHMHSDHIKGLSAQWCRGPLYCSAISATLLLAKFPGFHQSLIHVLQVGVPTLVPLLSNRTQSQMLVEVTPIDADHCPGAVMYVFRGDFGCIVHTGDFRWEAGGLCKDDLNVRKEQLLAALRGARVDCLYLDNTFCNARFCIPPRHIAAQQVVDLIADHQDNDVVLGLDALGKEELLIQIANFFKTKIWVWPQRLQTMRLLELPDVFTTDTTVTRIRAVPRYSISTETLDMMNKVRPTIAVLPTGSSQLWNPLCNFGPESKDDFTLHNSECFGDSTLITTREKSEHRGAWAMSEKQENIFVSERVDTKPRLQTRNYPVRALPGKIYLVSYSLHGCFSELQDFVDFIRPVSIIGNLQSIDCNINPAHHFWHLCGKGDRSPEHHHSRMNVSPTNTNGIRGSKTLSLIDPLSERHYLCKSYSKSVHHPPENLVIKKRGKASKAQFGNAHKAVRRKKRNLGGVLLSGSDVDLES